MLGLRELAMVAAVVLVLYGRTGTGLVRSRRFQSILPWIAPVRRNQPGRVEGGDGALRDGPGAPIASPAAAGPSALKKSRVFRLDGNRVFWFLTILAATAVATMIVTRSLILQGGSPGPHP